ncbi:MAG: helix-turn-helix transcriptional regulator [Paralcaligenes sp.]
MKPLTAKELACLRWAAIGKTSWEIGIILSTAERTVNFHIQNACHKLQVRGRQAAITAALQAGWLNAATGAPPMSEKTHRLLVAGKLGPAPLPDPRSGHSATPKP